jgi:phage shock protein A
MTKPQRRYTSADVAPLTQALQTISNVMNDQAAPLLLSIQKYSREWTQKLSSYGVDALRADLTQLQDDAKALSQKIYDVESKNEYYKDEIRYVGDAASGEFAGSAEGGARNLEWAFRGVTGPPNSETMALLGPWQRAFDDGNESLKKRIEQTKARIQEVRSDIERTPTK